MVALGSDPSCPTALQKCSRMLGAAMQGDSLQDLLSAMVSAAIARSLLRNGFSQQQLSDVWQCMLLVAKPVCEARADEVQVASQRFVETFLVYNSNLMHRRGGFIDRLTTLRLQELQ